MKLSGMVRTALLLVVVGFAPTVRADDWPNWMGPKRDNIWRETGILGKFPEGGPKVVWKAAVAGGYSGPAVAAGKVVVTDYVTKDNVKVDNFDRKTYSGIERVLCLDEATGKEIWKHELPVRYTISYPAGPRCTPVIHDGKVYTQGSEGHLFAFDLATGKIVWSHDLKAEYKTKSALWGYAGHPMIDGKKLICLVGGEGSHCVAFDTATGKVIWKALSSEERGYSSPTIVTAGGARQLLLPHPEGISAVDPETGKTLWEVDYAATNGSTIMSPIVWKDYLYFGGYSNKNLLLKLDADKPGATQVWRDVKGKGISPVNVQPIADGNVIYGFDQNGELMAVELPSGKRLWSTTAPLVKKPLPSGTAFIVRNGERYFLFNELGELLIAKLTPKGYEEIDRAKVISPSNVAFGRDVVWCMPAFANKRMYVRNDNELLCIDLSER